MSDRWWYEVDLLGPRDDDIWDIVEAAVKPLGYESQGGHGCREEHLDEIDAGRRDAIDRPSYDAGWTAGYEKAVENTRHAAEPDGGAAPTALTAPPATECASETIAAQRRDLAKAQTERGETWDAARLRFETRTDALRVRLAGTEDRINALKEERDNARRVLEAAGYREFAEDDREIAAAFGAEVKRHEESLRKLAEDD